MKIVRNTNVDPQWDNVSLTVTDFRSHFDGNLISLTSCINPAATIDETIINFKRTAREIAQWYVDNQGEFGADDRVQIVVGWPLSVRPVGRQVVKFGGELSLISSIAKGHTDVPVRTRLVGYVFDQRG